MLQGGLNLWVSFRPNEAIFCVLLMFKTIVALNYSVSIQISCALLFANDKLWLPVIMCNVFKRCNTAFYVSPAKHGRHIGIMSASLFLVSDG